MFVIILCINYTCIHVVVSVFTNEEAMKRFGKMTQSI